MLCLAAAAASIQLGCASLEKSGADPRDIVFPFQWIGEIDKRKLNEPSGIVFDSRRGTLFAVGDEGDICEIKPDGTLLRKKRLLKADFEGITLDPSTGKLYVAVEGDEQILEIDPETFKIVRAFAIERTFEGQTVLKGGGEGIEAITFIPDPNHPEGGVFLVANQSYDLASPDDVSCLFEVELPLKSSAEGQRVRISRLHRFGVIDLAGLHYDTARDCIYVVSDSTNTIYRLARDGTILSSRAFPGDNQEGIAVDSEGHIYIAQDSGGILKLKWLR
jgi:DNA-binding beta-propeller fold protein YncE